MLSDRPSPWRRDIGPLVAAGVCAVAVFVLLLWDITGSL
jgi:hypothetical protein